MSCFGEGSAVGNTKIDEEQNVIDPWIHRSTGMRCRTCMWFAPKENIGRCRRHAPIMSGYPVVFPTDWCGDHKLNEKSI